MTTDSKVLALSEMARQHPTLTKRLLDAGYQGHVVNDAGLYTRIGRVMHQGACLSKHVEVVTDEGVDHYYILLVVIDLSEAFNPGDTGVSFFVEFHSGKKESSMFEKVFFDTKFNVHDVERTIRRVYEAVTML